MKWLMFILFGLLSIIANAQDEEFLLANQFFQEGEYEKAAAIYEDLHKKSPKSYAIYKNYLATLIVLEDFEKSEKIVKKQIKRFSDDLSYTVDLGYVYLKSGNGSKAVQHFDKIVQSLPSSESKILQVSNSFWMINRYDYAINVLMKGKKLLKDYTAFDYDISRLYSHKGDIVNMIEVYLNILEYNPEDIEHIQQTLQDLFSSNKEFNVLKSALYKRIQKGLDNKVFTEFLIWLLIQQKEFEAAFIQVKAIDKRLKEDGSRVLQFARLCIDNESYDVGIKAYKYIQDKNVSYLYHTVTTELLNAQKLKITKTTFFTQEDLVELEKEYEEFITEYGRNANTANAIIDLAHLKAFYLYNVKAAIEDLQLVINLPNVNRHLKANCKITLGDVYLIDGDIWEASLLYSQVDKAFREDPIGDNARFNNAKLSYYIGDFVWAKAQLDVLKASTSKLISNDALNLSTFIIDNFSLDSLAEPLLLYAHSELFVFQNRPDEAIKKLDSITRFYSYSSLYDDVLYSKAEIYIRKGEYDLATKLLDQIINEFSFDIKADDALFLISDLYLNMFKDQSKAMYYLEKLITEYPDSLYSVKARATFRDLRGDT